MKPYILVATPTYGSGVHNFAARLEAMRVQFGPRQGIVRHAEFSSSLLTWNCNILWTGALNMRREGLTHFLMLHSDVRPVGENWLNVMLDEMEAHEAQVLSAIIPIKSPDGLFSTARDTDYWEPTRYTYQQIRDLPETWTTPDLLFNTGLMLVDFRGDWVEKVDFTIRDKIHCVDGQWRAYVAPEDWNFARQCRPLGVRCFVTRKIAVEHFGVGMWSSEKP